MQWHWGKIGLQNLEENPTAPPESQEAGIQNSRFKKLVSPAG